MTLPFHLRLAGTLLMLLGLSHLTFGRFLNWRSDLAKLSVINRQIFRVHCFYIALLLIMLGALSAFGTSLLLQPHPLARIILATSALLWGIRLYVQWFFFDRSLWRGTKPRTISHGFLGLPDRAEHLRVSQDLELAEPDELAKRAATKPPIRSRRRILPVPPNSGDSIHPSGASCGTLLF
jgi:hypothetical protein